MNSSRSLQTESVIYFVISLRLILQIYVCILQKLYTKRTKHALSFDTSAGSMTSVSMAASAIINQQQIYMVSTDFSVLNTNDCCVLNRKWLNNDNLWVEWSWTLSTLCSDGKDISVSSCQCIWLNSSFVGCQRCEIVNRIM